MIKASTGETTTNAASAFPIRALVVGLAVTAVLFAGVGKHIWDSYQDLQAAQERNFRLQELTGVITHLDEVLTMSARMAAVTGDLRWEARYNEFEPQLGAAIEESEAVAPQVYAGEAAVQTDAANVALVEMERRAFGLVRASQTGAAASVLFSPEYEDQKQVYAQGNAEIARSLAVNGEEAVQSAQRQWLIAIVAVAAPTLLAVWLAVAVSTQRHIAARKRTEEALRAGEERYRWLIEGAPDALVIADSDGRIMMMNSQSESMFGYQRHELLGEHVELLMPDRFREVHARQRADYSANPQPRRMGTGRADLAGLRKDGSEFPVEIGLSALQVGDSLLQMAAVRDITERKRMEEALREQARRDPLTGVLHHGAIVEELLALASQGNDATGAVAMVDVDGLKVTNDTYGHQVGDAALVAIAGSLATDGAIVGRYGGDEFIVLLSGVNRRGAQRYCNAVRARLLHASQVDPLTGGLVPLAATIGVAMYPQDAKTAAELIKLADTAMYAQRRQQPATSQRQDRRARDAA